MSREYRKLTQNEKDIESTNYAFKPIEKKRSCCVITFFISVVFVLICGGMVILGGIFFKPQMDTMISSYWTPQTSDTGGHRNSTTLVPTDTLEKMTTIIFPLSPLNHSSQNASTEKQIINSEKNSTVLQTKPHSDESSTEDTLEDGDNESGEEEEEDEPITTTTTTTSHPLKHHGKKNSTNLTNESHEEGVIGNHTVSLDNAQEKFATWMIKFERLLEDLTGIRRPELVVPLFMLLCFILSLSLASCCCYLMMKRRETLRRRILGKMITDLQTGDSKAVLLDQDGDD